MTNDLHELESDVFLLPKVGRLGSRRVDRMFWMEYFIG